ncbi:MAG: Rieske (2Fe-2S) protein, partial [Gallionellaceae bacterium CG11_big_fil_rev_8_21_14_0_20_60_62]
MSEIARLKQFNPVSAQPPLRWYFDPQVLEIEQRALFDTGPQYVGHELMTPNAGDYHVLEWMDNARMLVRNENGVELLSNICRHRQATLLEGR